MLALPHVRGLFQRWADTILYDICPITGCEDTGLFGCFCCHDSVISFCNICKAGEGQGLSMSIIKSLFANIKPSVNVGVLYNIGSTLGKFLEKCGLLTVYLPQMTFATVVFHLYVHNWPCQLQFNPQHNNGWGLNDGEGLQSASVVEEGGSDVA
ncbi:hypothetical protein PSTG_02474 [Puccinia striiformis f. sp. tritici PST-78]|uniref:CxC2-like cysteine cluster KDZ transposase-associated domain-containing protein n=1 Tax=Puccinia striiformis f. sp. tritici PST-78 TaxID=1165861 RepID=A0A0L0VZ44_9BASI|nr:hypothetical protein PSTG_02474 [Puccinia striiformis f. sp. tritici PST-78]